MLWYRPKLSGMNPSTRRTLSGSSITEYPQMNASPAR
jgi:hypothetical protein